LILRDCTERPESVESGHSVLCKIEHKAILEQVKILEMNRSKGMPSVRSPYGSGDTAAKIVKILEKKYA
jgi:UDP-N-acetylglucosamine 2-epimerase